MFACCSQFFGAVCVVWTDDGGGEILTILRGLSIFELLKQR